MWTTGVLLVLTHCHIKTVDEDPDAASPAPRLFVLHRSRHDPQLFLLYEAASVVASNRVRDVGIFFRCYNGTIMVPII